MNRTYFDVEKRAIGQLEQAGIHSAVKDANILLQHVTGMERAELLARPMEICPENSLAIFQGLIDRRIQREPVYRITSMREFHGLQLGLNPATLEPRDDTETLVDTCLAQIEDKNANLNFLDLGTGTGAIALALLSECPNAHATATDISEAALVMAVKNARSAGFGKRFSPVQSSWFDRIDGCFDFIVSNPPYIPSSVVDSLEPEVLLHDPRCALDGGDDGFDAYRAIFAQAYNHLKPQGFLALEIGYDQKNSIRERGQQSGWKFKCAARDMGGNDRAIVFKR